MTPALRRFFASESAGGIVLAMMAVLALVISNSPWANHYARWVALPVELRVGDAFVLAKPAVVWVNDLWMAVFFFVVGLEIKRELIVGELSNRDQAMLPALAALGGMVVPALIYAAINSQNAVALKGWAIPSATDIAFAIGIATLLGSRVPTSLKVFLTAVAIIDDLGAIGVIAVFYTEQLSQPMLGGAGFCAVVLLALNRAQVKRVDVYAAVGLVMWFFVLKSGIHATLAGVATAMFVPLSDGGGGSPLEGAERALHPWVAYGILPVFAFFNAGVSLAGVDRAVLTSPVPWGIALGLVVGKPVGVFGTVWLLCRFGISRWPAGASRRQTLGVAALCGIGFTMSLFIGGLAFAGASPAFEVALKLGVLGGSAVSALIGVLILRSSTPPASRRDHLRRVH